MKLWLAAVGRARPGPLRELYEDYAARLGAPFGPLSLREIEVRPALPPDQRRAREGEQLLGAVPAGAILVALDERGRDFSSEELAGRLAAWREQAVADLAFLIGGADGHAEPVRARADLLLAFGRATWPHLLVRVMLAEQLYRARTILEGHPYHRG
jgi:23S rRNA (pseudouridine1915-N3)-methyltransferase